jgi:diguanylate cyclase (GGDEF)-like protein
MGHPNRILFVDDDKHILSALERLSGIAGYETHSALSGEEGLEILRKHSPIPVVVSDYQMPGMNGVDFLKKVAELWPDTIRIILTAHEETKILLSSINEGNVYKFVLKPWDDDELKITIANAIERYELRLQNKQLYESLMASNEELRRLNAYLSYYDPVTDMPNKSLFCDRIDMSISRSKHHNRLVAVVIAGIDNFGLVIDTFGPKNADKILVEISGRLAALVRDGDTVARLGTSDFGLVLNDIARKDDVLSLIDRIRTSIAKPISMDSGEFRVTASIGISIFPDDAQNMQELMRNAYLSLTQARKSGGNDFKFYIPEMNRKASEFVEMEKRLLKAIDNREFVLHYQPYFDAETGRIKGLESLLRLKTTDHGLIMPARFIHVLEETDLIHEVGNWVLDEALRQIKQWIEEGYKVVPVTVNLSAVQFRQRESITSIGKVISGSGVDPRYLSCELTESTLMQDVDFAVSAVNSLKELGVSILIDDFGTAYSSLNYLAKFNADYLKIDISFIREITAKKTDEAIVKAIILMAHSMDMKTIAEGIETEAQLRAVRALGCDMIQGFLFSKPVPPEQLGGTFLERS